LGITGWAEGEAYDAGARCFTDWVYARGTLRGSDEVAAVKQVRGFIQQHSASRFMHEGDNKKRPIYKQAGFTQTNQKTGVLEHLIFPEVFEKEVCAAFDPQFVARALRDRGMLVVEKDGHLKVKRHLRSRIGGTNETRMYAVILAGDQ
jgi:putative DNA primase/helicase